MTLIYKFTTGFVKQTFDTEQGKFVSQEFTAGDCVEYEDEHQFPVFPERFKDENGKKCYLPFDMVQPEERETINELIDNLKSFDGKYPENISSDLWERLRKISGG